MDIFAATFRPAPAGRLAVLCLGAALSLTVPAGALAEGFDKVDRAAAAEPLLAAAGQDQIPGALGAQGWRLLELPGVAATEFALSPAGVIEVRAEGSAAFLYRDLQGSEKDRWILRWRWLVEETGPVTDLSTRGGDDRPLAVHIWFPEDPQEIGLWGSLKRTAADIFDVPVPGKVLTYVWGGAQERGEKFANPYLEDNGAIIVLRSGRQAAGRWYAEEIDIVADFVMAFGYQPPVPSHLAVSADSDDRGGRTQGLIANLRFEG